jgi:methylenetetrahydrofolate dehydrogenase (NADP+)/methenyltetrahydrofolate cyclohydrolase
LWNGDPGLVPCTSQGILLLLRASEVPLIGAEAVVLGRSGIVGRPVAALLITADCTVTIVHSKSRDLPGICRRADILVAAIGRPQMVKANWLKPGAAVIDVGINRVATEDGTRLVGDVDFADARHVAGAISPVPGGVGPMTIACLLRNTLLAACRRRGLPDPAGL